MVGPSKTGVCTTKIENRSRQLSMAAFAGAVCDAPKKQPPPRVTKTVRLRLQSGEVARADPKWTLVGGEDGEDAKDFLANIAASRALFTFRSESTN